MPKSKKGRKKAWTVPREWAVFALIAVVIIAIGVIGALRGGQDTGRHIGRTAPYRLYLTQGGAEPLEPGALEALIVEDIAAATASVHLATPGLDLPATAAALVAAHERGVAVRVLHDAAAQQDPAVEAVTRQLQQAGIPVVLREAPGSLGGAFVVVDQQVVWAGSWDFSRRGLEEDQALVLRWGMVEMARNFEVEFMEMFADGAFGPTSPQNTPYGNIVIPAVSSISVYMTPEDEPLAEILQALAKTEREVFLLTGGLDDPRLGDRLIGEARVVNQSLWAIVGEEGSSEQIVDELERYAAGLLRYRGPGRLLSNVILIDGELVCIFSQPLRQENLAGHDGYVLLVRDPELSKALRQEIGRLVGIVQGQP